LCTTERFSTSVLENVSDLLATRLATVLVEALWEAVLLFDDVLLSVFITATLFELLEDSALFDAAFTVADCSCCAAREAVLVCAKLSDAAALAVRLALEDLFAVAFKELAPLPELVAVSDLLVVPLDADPPLAALRVLLAVPTLDEVAPPLVPLLLNVELPVFEAVELVGMGIRPGGGVVTVFAVEFELEVALEAFARLVDAPNVAAAELDLLALREPFAANAFVVEFDLLAFSEAEEDSVAPNVLLELDICDLLLLAVKLFVSELLCELVSLKEEVSLAVWLREALVLLDLLLFSVSFELLVSVSWLFCPRW
jgi:hypothetical protein